MNYVDSTYVRSGYVRLDSDTQGGFTFDGHGRLIIVSDQVTSFSIAEMYSRWKDWTKASIVGDSSSKWLPAMRYSGSDPIPGGFTGATFFVQNGWRMLYSPSTTSVSGVLFSEDFGTAFYTYALQPVFPVTVSAVVNQVTTVQNIVTGDLSTVPTAAATALAVEASLGPRFKQVENLVSATL